MELYLLALAQEPIPILSTSVDNINIILWRTTRCDACALVARGVLLTRVKNHASCLPSPYWSGLSNIPFTLSHGGHRDLSPLEVWRQNLMANYYQRSEILKSDKSACRPMGCAYYGASAHHLHMPCARHAHDAHDMRMMRMTCSNMNMLSIHHDHGYKTNGSKILVKSPSRV